MSLSRWEVRLEPRGDVVRLIEAEDFSIHQEERSAVFRNSAGEVERVPLRPGVTITRESANVCGTYTLTAIPWPLSNGKVIERLEYVMFVAKDGEETQRWSLTHTPTFIEYLSRIVSSAEARNIYGCLLRGEPVTFPVLFGPEQIQQKFRKVDQHQLSISV